MCGLAGFAGKGTQDHLAAMSALLAHRGPDGEGIYTEPDKAVFLAHRRLAVLDIPGGHQPMWNEDGSIAVIFNGEIYNHADLRRELEKSGHSFRTDHSDTEVLVHGYEEWGEALPLRLNGMFAFAAYDRKRKRIFLARDRFGKKPLYYFEDPSLFAFASELKSILAHPGVSSEVDPVSLQKYFAYGFIPAPRSLYRNVCKLPGGHSATFDLDTRRLSKRCYYRFQIAHDDRIARASEEAVAEELRTLLRAAVRRRLVADVPLGMLLSGGLDSSAVLALATGALPSGQVKTFSIGFREASFDESRFARDAAAHFHADHHEEILDVTAARDIAGDVLQSLDEPMGDSSILPTYLLSRFARQHVTVALGGDGGDEMFAGYDPMRALRPAIWYYRMLPAAARRGARRMAEWLPASERYMSLDFRLKRVLRGLEYPPSLWNPVWLGPLEPSEIGELLQQPVSCEALYEEAITAWEASPANHLLDKTSEFYARFYLQEGVLAKVDRASMKVALEVRAPFLDNDVTEFARRVPASLKLRGGTGKYILKRAMTGILPDSILSRRKKGFGIPLTGWLKTWPTPEASSSLRYNEKWLAKTWKGHGAGKRDERLFLWCWIVLQAHFQGLKSANL